jgi:hypothetical protein
MAERDCDIKGSTREATTIITSQSKYDILHNSYVLLHQETSMQVITNLKDIVGKDEGN